MSDKQISVSETMKLLNKKYGANTIVKMDEKHAINVESVPTSSFSLDYVLGCGGFPRGRIIEIFGQESSGKSTLAMFIVAQLQKQGSKAVWIDAECSFSNDYAQKIGIDTDQLLVAQPSSGEEALDIVDKMAQTNEIDIIVLDSVAALLPKKELEGNITDQDMALQARMMSKGMRKLTSNLSKTKTAAIFINQLREKVGVFWGKKETTPGGKALKFFASVRLEVKKGKLIKDKAGEVLGNNMEICAIKNKVGFPLRKTSLELYYEKGIDLTGDLVDFCLARNIVFRTGASYAYMDIKLGAGREQAKKFLDENPEVLEKIREDAKKYDGPIFKQESENRDDGGAGEVS